MAADSGHTAHAEEQSPRSVFVLGRRAGRENASICGEYSYCGVHGGYPLYQNRTGITIRFCAPSGRWVISEGIRDPDTAMAYADGAARSHPGYPELIWHVWESAAQSFMQDSEVVVVNAPGVVTFVGRSPELVNSFVNGKFLLVGAFHGKAAYRHEVEDIIIRFDAMDGRWKLAEPRSEDTCYAWAEDQNLTHPGEPGLQWNFWDPDRRAFSADLNAGAVVSPDVVHMLGRNSQADRMNGMYHLAGLHCCRPMYTKLGTQAVIRYSQKNDCWLIDSDGLSKPSVLGRIYQWVLAGNSEKTSERCIAYAPAQGAKHPGNCQLQWHIWDHLSGQHRLEATVMSTSAPMSIEMRGRDSSRDNFDINGEYCFIGAVAGFPAYQQAGTKTCIYYSEHCDKWIVDRQGVRDSDTASACSDGSGANHPVDVACWRVFESSRAVFVSDPAVTVVECTSPQPIAVEDTVPAAMKRRFDLDDQTVNDIQHPGKVARVENRTGHPSWFRAFGA